MAAGREPNSRGRGGTVPQDLAFILPPMVAGCSLRALLLMESLEGGGDRGWARLQGGRSKAVPGAARTALVENFAHAPQEPRRPPPDHPELESPDRFGPRKLLLYLVYKGYHVVGAYLISQNAHLDFDPRW